MFIDLSFEFDCSSDEFINEGVMEAEEGSRWISAHTEKGQKLLEKLGISSELHKRVKISHDEYLELMLYLRSDKTTSKSIGGFFWKNKSHTDHL